MPSKQVTILGIMHWEGDGPGDSGGAHPSHPIALPPGVPTHPIAGPPPGIWPSPGVPTHPIAPPPLSPTHPIAPGGTPPVPGTPTHPIVLPPEVPPPADARPIVTPPAVGVPIDYTLYFSPTYGFILMPKSTPPTTPA